MFKTNWPAATRGPIEVKSEGFMSQTPQLKAEKLLRNFQETKLMIEEISIFFMKG